MSNLAQRLITGSIFVAVLVGCICWGVWSMVGLCLIITVLGLNEFYNLAVKAKAEPQKLFGIFVGAATVIIIFIHAGLHFPTLLICLIPLISMIFFIELFRKKENPFANISWTIAGLIYIALPMGMIIWNFVPYQYLAPLVDEEIFPRPYEFQKLLMLFILIWVSDSMAYVCGRLFGKHKLWERISPKKTWEGFIGGLIFTVLTAGFVAHWCFADTHTYHSEIKWCVIGFVISVTGMLGDMVESLFKRSI
ncbi:MAG TPA: phosphatidate cytidylyltransferase, partial [Bacteroidia bacterium]|nr:phosphatidate cytidylyltransferase [Bacteroidia bacterium]